MARILVFAGPTLSRKQILSIVPGVEVLPPVASGDLLRLPLVAGDLVAIIDGFYFQSAAVRHKEILFLRGDHDFSKFFMIQGLFSFAQHFQIVNRRFDRNHRSLE